METVVMNGQLYIKEVVPKAPGAERQIINLRPVLSDDERKRREQRAYRALYEFLKKA
jgi:hypothetical protein